MLDKLFKTIEKITPQKWRWILSHEGFRRYFANTGWMFFGQMFSLLVSFFIGAWLARYLGPENYGVLSYAVAFVGLFAFIADLGSSGIIYRDLIQYPERRNEILGTGFVIKLIGGSISFLIAVFVSFLIKSDVLTRILIILFALGPLFQSIHIIAIFFQAEVKAKKVVRVQLITMVISSILKILLILFGLGVFWLSLIYVLDILWQGLFLFISYRKSGFKISSWKFDQVLARGIWRNSWPLMLSGAASFALLKIDQVMIGRLMDKGSVGIYAAAVKIVEVFYFIPGIICASLFPAIVNAKKSDEKTYNRRLNNLYILMVFAAIFVALPSFFLAPWGIKILFGEAFLGSIVVLQIYVWSGVGLFLGAAVNQYLMVENMSKTIFVTSLFVTIANIVLNLIFIPRCGLMGAAWATLISYSALPIIILGGKKVFSKYIH